MRIILIVAQSVDGFITRHDEPGSGFASAADQAHFRAALAECDAWMMGRVAYESARAAIRAAIPTAPRQRIVITREPERFAAEAVPGRLEFTAEAPAALAARLRASGRQRCALLGGAQIHSLFLAAGLVDEVWLTLEPRLFGAGTPLLAQAADYSLRLLSAGPLGPDTLLLKYAVASRAPSSSPDSA